MRLLLTITSHGSQVTTLLQHFDDLVLVLGENFSETVCALDQVVLSSTGETAVNELGRVVDLGSEGKHLAGFLSDSDSITSQHLDGDTELLGFDDSLGSILTRGVEHRQETEEDPWAIVDLVSDTERTETTASEISSLLTEKAGSFFITVGEGEDSLGGTLGTDILVTSHVADGSNTLGDGVEGSELLGPPALSEDLAGLGVTPDREESDLVDGVEGLEVVRRSESGNSHHPVDVLAFSDVGLTDRELVGSESTGLVRAENVDTSEGLNGGKLLYNSLLLSEVGGTDSQGGRGDDGKTDGHTDDEENQSVVEKGDRVAVGLASDGDGNVTEETTDPRGEDEEHDQDKKRRTDGVHDSLEVTLILGTSNETGGATDERVLSRGEGNTVGLAALATSGVVSDFAHVLVDSERLSGDGGLIGSNERDTLVDGTLVVIIILLVIGVVRLVEHVLLLKLKVGLVVLRSVEVADKTDISGDSVSFLDDDDVTGDDFTGEDGDWAAVTNDSSLHGDVSLQTGDNVGSLLFLVPTDNSVKQENTADDTEINPVTKTSSEKSSNFHD